MINYVYIMYYLEQSLKKLYIHIFKKTTNKSKWSSKNCSSNPQDSRKRKQRNKQTKKNRTTIQQKI